MAPSPKTYDSWTREDLIARITHLEQQPTRPRPPKFAENQKPFDFSKHPKRKIALKFCYHGIYYNGLEFQKGPTPLPTVEAVLFEALVRTRLIDPHVDFKGCEWEKCGRTDRGVSAAGQVISLWVRSALGNVQAPASEQISSSVQEDSSSSVEPSVSTNVDTPTIDDSVMDDWDESPKLKPKVELHYVSLLNKVLPPTIRVLAWSPVAPDFSARFACQYRHYKYFFNSEGLNIAPMQEAAARLVGEHDFRNLCKLDAAKQLLTFRRRILSATISAVPGPSYGQYYVLDLVGTAFLYNQVRNIMAILFLVGTGLEQPSIITALLNVDPENIEPPAREGEAPPPLVLSKPEFQMADAFPLVLWECAYRSSDVQWRTDGREASASVDATAPRDFASDLHYQLTSILERSMVHTLLDTQFLAAAARYHAPAPQYLPVTPPGGLVIPEKGMLSVPLGGGTFKRGAKYVPVLERKRMDTVDVAHERWRVGPGARKIVRKNQELAEGDE